MINFILKTIAPIPKIKEAKKVLVVGPHPDDIEVGAGGLVAYLTRNNIEVIFLICTDGGAGYVNEGDNVDNLITRRKEEALLSSKILRVNNIIHLNYKDGCNYDVWDLSLSIARVIMNNEPDFVLCPDPDLPSEIHPDHIKCGIATKNAIFIATNKLVAIRNNLEINEEYFKKKPMINLGLYYTHRPNSYLNINKEDFDLMINAIKTHKSQFSFSEIKMLTKYITLKTRKFNLIKKYKIGIFALSPLHQHCFIEINRW